MEQLEREAIIHAVGAALDVIQRAPSTREAVDGMDFAQATFERSALVNTAKRLLRIRRRREKIIGPGAFADPLWDLLLEMYVHTASGRSMTITSACYSMHVPHTTGLRWLRVAEERGLIIRFASPLDRRVSHIDLTAEARDKVEQILEFSTQSLR